MTVTDTQAEAMYMLNAGYPQKDICAELGVTIGTLTTWVKRADLPRKRRTYLVSHIRELLADLDAGTPIKVLSKQTGVNRATIRRWRDDPRFRNATFEYDEDFDYDDDDLADRSVVAHHLCTLTLDLTERLEMVLASAGINLELQDDNSNDHRPRYNPRANKRKAD